MAERFYGTDEEVSGKSTARSRLSWENAARSIGLGEVAWNRYSARGMLGRLRITGRCVNCSRPAARTGRLGGLIEALLRDSGTDAVVRDGEPPMVVFWHDGGAVVLGLAWEAAASDEFEHAVRQSAPDASVILLSVGGFAGQVRGEVAAGSGATIKWDGTHLEALVCGLITVQGLLEASRRTALLSSIPYPSLAQLLTGPGDPPPARMMTPDLLPPPWAFPGAWCSGIPAELLLAGEDGWDKPTGIAVIGDRRLVAVTRSGLIELDAARGVTSWILPLRAARMNRWC